MKYFLSMLTVLFALSPSLGQYFKGKVTDQLNSPLIGAHVINQTTNLGTTTDIDGNFRIEASKGDTIFFSMIGFLERKLVADNQMEGNLIELEEDTYRLRAFTVTGDRIGQSVFGLPSKEDYLEAVRIGSFVDNNEYLAPRVGFGRKSYKDKLAKQKRKIEVVIDQERRLDNYYLLKEDEEFTSELITLYPKVANHMDEAFAGFVQHHLQVIYTSSLEEVKASLLLYIAENYS